MLVSRYIAEAYLLIRADPLLVLAPLVLMALIAGGAVAYLYIAG